MALQHAAAAAPRLINKLASLLSDLPSAAPLLAAVHTSLPTSPSHALGRCYSQLPPSSSPAHPPIQWVFLGAPGVGKGTYASRAAKHFNVAHIATGDLVRGEIKQGSSLGREISNIVQQGGLVPDDLVLELLDRRLASGRGSGERGFILDGFPRTRVQAEKLHGAHQLQVAFNLGLREEVLVEKCMGRRLCRHCGKSYNIADISLAADPSSGKPQIILPPLPPPLECAPHLETREDDTAPVIRKRLEAYHAQAGPVEQYFQDAGLLCNFEITAGIPETLPSLLASLSRYVPKSAGEGGDRL